LVIYHLGEGGKGKKKAVRQNRKEKKSAGKNSQAEKSLMILKDEKLKLRLDLFTTIK